jgi:hypothetical protein
MDMINPEYNILPYAGRIGRGRVVSEKTRSEISARMIGNKYGIGAIHVFDKELIKKISDAHKGNIQSKETRNWIKN